MGVELSIWEDFGAGSPRIQQTQRIVPVPSRSSSAPHEAWLLLHVHHRLFLGH